NCDPLPGITHPIVYARSTTVMGGYLYQGNLNPSLRGSYVYATFDGNGHLWAARRTANGWASSEIGNVPGFRGLGRDRDGELLVSTNTGDVGYLVPANFENSDPTADLDDGDGDGMPDLVENTEGLNPTVKDNDIFSNARWFVMQQYRDFLGRQTD